MIEAIAISYSWLVISISPLIGGIILANRLKILNFPDLFIHTQPIISPSYETSAQQKNIIPIWNSSLILADFLSYKQQLLWNISKRNF